MRFLERVKTKLLNQIDEKIAQIEDKINELNQEHSSRFENVENKSMKLEEILQEKSEIQKTKIDGKELKDIETIYNFMFYYKKIKYIIEELKRLPLIENDYEYPDTYTDEILHVENLIRRNNLLEELKKLNKKIKDIDELYIEEDFQKVENVVSPQTTKKRGFFSRLFGKNQKEDTSNSYNNDEDSKENIFVQYRRTISEFKKYYNSFLTQTDGKIVNQDACRRGVDNIRYFCKLQKNGTELFEEDKQLLEFLKPWDLWPEILRYYSNMEKIRIIIQNFEAKIDYFEQLYTEDSEFFDLDKLHNIIENNKETEEDLKARKKDVDNMNAELSKAREESKNIKDQITALKNKKNRLLEERKKVEKARTLKELGYKDKNDTAEKLSIDVKDYIIIPIPSSVSDIDKVFNYNKQLKIQIDEKTFYTSYSNEVAFGSINSLKYANNAIGAILVPINELDKNNIDCVRGDKIGLNKSILKISGVKIYLEREKFVRHSGKTMGKVTYFDKDLEQQIKTFLGEDYITDDEKPEEYQVLKNNPNVSQKENKAKREAIRTSIFENLNREVSHKDRFLVDGKQYSLNIEEVNELYSKPAPEEIDYDILYKIIVDIEDYLKGKKNSIDALYGYLFKEYLRVVKKAKANYIDEEDTIIKYNDKRISIKPPLPPKNEDIARRYTRPNEDVAYKLMKLANLVNNFAHITNDAFVQYELFEKKLELIERVIDLSKDNPKIHIKKQFDEYKKANGVIMEIPGYNMIALHTINSNRVQMNKINRLEERNDKVLSTSTTLYPGVNRELITTLRKMNQDNRCRFLLGLAPNTFTKLIIRMGYSDVSITSNEEREKFINTIISDEKLDKLLEECDKIERE